MTTRAQVELPCIVTADERRATLYTSRRDADGHWHLDEQAQIENRWEDLHEHHRPYALDRHPAPGSQAHFSSGFSEREGQEERTRFVRELVPWLQQHRAGGAPIAIFAAPGLFGLLRSELGSTKGAELHELELTRLRATELAAHPAVVKALSGAGHARV